MIHHSELGIVFELPKEEQDDWDELNLTMDEYLWRLAEETGKSTLSLETEDTYYVSAR